MSVPGIREEILKAQAYVAGKTIEEVQREYGLESVIKLGSNENPYAPFPAARAAMIEEIDRIHEYPDASFRDLRANIGARFGRDASSVAIGHGAGGILETLAATFLRTGDEVILPTQSYGLYREISKVAGATVKEVSLNEQFTIDPDAMRAALTGKTRIVWLCNPNNPTGTVVDVAAYERLRDALPPTAWLVVDEAYAEFAAEENLPATAQDLDDHNVVIVRTFSKAFGLAGGRIGYAVARPDLVRVIDTVSEPFNANRIGIAGARACLTDDWPNVQAALKRLQASRTRLERELSARGLEVTTTHTNFVFFEVGVDADALAEAMLRRGVIVRSASAWGYPAHLRVTMGTEAQNDVFLSTLDSALDEIRKE